MKYYLPKFLLFVVFFTFTILPCTSQSLDQSVKYGNVNFNIPTDWFYNTKDFPNGNKTINCGKRGLPNSFTINKINADISIQEGIQLTKDEFSKIPLLRSINFPTPQNSSFNGFDSKEVSFSILYNGENFVGNIISFKPNNKVYVIMYMGTESFNNGKLLQNILESVKVI